jgi:hypothetical protein
MAQLSTLEYLAISAQNNIDNIIEFSPYSTDIRIEKLKDTTETEVFGYETPQLEKEYISKGLIIFNPTKRWLNKIGIFLEKSEGLPQIALLKHSDNLKKKDVIHQIIKDSVNGQIVEIERDFEIVDILSYGGQQSIRKAYKISPYRGNSSKIKKIEEK